MMADFTQSLFLTSTWSIIIETCGLTNLILSVIALFYQMCRGLFTIFVISFYEWFFFF